jgi:glutamyl-tRNA reductase
VLPEDDVKPTLLVVGLNYRTAPIAVRERFWISEAQAYNVLHQLSRAEGVEEIVVLATCNRTEFIIWSDDFPAAAESVLSVLTHQFGLCLHEWQYFYQLLDEEGLQHIFRVASSLDSMVVGEPQITGQVKEAWTRARNAGTSGRILDAVFQKALAVSRKVRNETAIGKLSVSVPCAAVELAKGIFGRLEDCKVLIMGTGETSELAAQCLKKNGACSLSVINRTYEHALKLAEQLGGKAGQFQERWPLLVESDIVISSTGCPHIVLTRDEVEHICNQRQGRPLFLIDIAVPRDIEPSVREIKGAFLYDMDDLSRAVAGNHGERQVAARAAESIIEMEARKSFPKLSAEHFVPTVVALFDSINRICEKEAEKCRSEVGQMSQREQQIADIIARRTAQRIASVLARELKRTRRKSQQEQLVAVVELLFHLHPPVTQHKKHPTQPTRRTD